MKKNTLFALLLLSVLFQNCKNNTTPATPSVETPKSAVENAGVAAAKIVFVNIDSLQDKYTYFKQQKAAFEQKERELSASIDNKLQKLQNDMVALQQRAQQGTTPPAQIQQEGQSLQKREQALVQERDRKAKELLDETSKFNEQLMKKINDVLAQLQKDKGFDYVMRHTEAGGSPVLFVNPKYDITNEVLAILNTAPVK
jgi:outer membrane protein